VFTLFDIIRDRLSICYGLKGQNNIAQPNRLGKQIAFSFFLALKGQNKEQMIMLLLRSVLKTGTSKPQGVALGYVILHFQCGVEPSVAESEKP
jgi:hypothetical protein